MEGTHDNENTTLQPLSLATRRLLESSEQKKKQTGGDSNSRDGSEKKTEKDRADIEKRLRKVTARLAKLRKN